MIIRARTVLPIEGPPIENGAVAVAGNRVVAVGDAAEVMTAHPGAVTDLGEVVLMPGLINAHCHLDYSMMRHAIDPPKSFTAWVQRINALKRSLDDDDYLAAIAKGFAESRRWGTTSIGNIEAFPELMLRLPLSPLRTWWFHEMIDIRHRLPTERAMAGALSFFAAKTRPLDRFGLSPHAPYTASATLYKLARECSAQLAMPLTTHVAESREEMAMFRDKTGPLYEFLAGLERPMADCGGHSPFSYLWRSGSIDSAWVLVHMNELDEEDFAILGSLPRGGGPHIVHCPGSHRYFGHTPFQLRRLHDLGVNLCTATDSLASTYSLSLLEELRLLEKTDGWLTPEQMLRTVTVNPARALQRGHDLGKIAPGAMADLIAIPASGNVASLHEEIISYTRPVPWMMIDGNVVS
jgi:aminodeoxyfutalosine deaminase